MGFSLSLEQVESMLDAFVRAEGEPESVQLSGGEPSIHPQILEMLRAARDRGIQLVMLNTNGIRLARDPRFAPALAEIGVHVYLQFDGLQQATQLAIRGKCCVSEIVPDGRLIPFCAYNSVGYREQMRLALSGGTGRGAIVPDPEGIITGGHENETARTVAVHEGETVNAPALSAMIKQIIANNRAGGWRKLKREA